MLNWYDDQTYEREEFAKRCARDRDELLLELTLRFPRLEQLRNSENVENVILEVCGFHVVDRPLALGQLALCDFASKTVSVNSQMDRFVHHKTSLKLLRWSTLAHELGHIRLHAAEMSEGCFISFYGNSGQFTDARAYQKEREADFYANIFLVPEENLLEERLIQNLQKKRSAKRQLETGTLWKKIYLLSQTYKVDPALMKRCLIELGWIQQGSMKDSGLRELELCFR